ncbi:MAG: hypothetical protein HC848_04415 [Limnobacter sp.]|nr:hypothetical protein [Limnobacter sp.]
MIIFSPATMQHPIPAPQPFYLTSELSDHENTLHQAGFTHDRIKRIADKREKNYRATVRALAEHLPNLQVIGGLGFGPERITNMLRRARAHAAAEIELLATASTKETLSQFINYGLKPANVSSMLSGAQTSLAKALYTLHNNINDFIALTKDPFNIPIKTLSGILHNSGTKIGENIQLLSRNREKLPQMIQPRAISNSYILKTLREQAAAPTAHPSEPEHNLATVVRPAETIITTGHTSEAAEAADSNEFIDFLLSEVLGEGDLTQQPCLSSGQPPEAKRQRTQ